MVVGKALNNKYQLHCNSRESNKLKAAKRHLVTIDQGRANQQLISIQLASKHPIKSQLAINYEVISIQLASNQEPISNQLRRH